VAGAERRAPKRLDEGPLGVAVCLPLREIVSPVVLQNNSLSVDNSFFLAPWLAGCASSLAARVFMGVHGRERLCDCESGGVHERNEVDR